MKGDPRAGRPMGRVNDVTLEVRHFCRALVQDPEYRQALKSRLIAGKAGDMEKIIWAYGYGAPPDRPLTSMSLLLEELDGTGEASA